MCAAAVGGSYQRFLALWVLQMCSAKVGNVEGSSNEGVLSQTTCGSKSRKRGSYLVVTAKAVYSVYYPRLLGLSTARECIVFALRNSCGFSGFLCT